MPGIHVPSRDRITVGERAPGLVVSLALHAALFFLLMNTMKGCGGSPRTQGTDEFVSFGLVERQVPSEEQDTADEPTDSEVTQPTDNVIDTVPIDDAPPADLNQPSESLPLIGAGPPPLPPSVVDGDISEVPSKVGGSALRTPLGLGPGETAFVDIRDSGKKFVYAIDCSGSMVGDRMAFARAQLISSINLLDPSQQFQVLFYNTSVRVLKIRSQTGNKLYPANAQNTSAAVRAIRQVRPDDGTRHAPALERALRLGPDVIFFLTDGHDRPLSVGDLERIRRMNTGDTRIHCIEFGQGPLLTAQSWLRTLASQNDGQYKYFDVNNLQRGNAAGQ